LVSSLYICAIHSYTYNPYINQIMKKIKSNGKLSKKQKRSIRRKVDLELGHEPFSTKIHKPKTLYKRRPKHRGDYEAEVE